jgi:integrase
MATVRGSSLRHRHRHRHRHRRSSLMEARISWGVMERATGIEPARSVTMHGLRHAYASWLLAGGADLHVMKERLGHAKMTTEGYLHTLPSADETALAAVSKIRGSGVADEEAELIVAKREIEDSRRPSSP